MKISITEDFIIDLEEVLAVRLNTHVDSSEVMGYYISFYTKTGEEITSPIFKDRETALRVMNVVRDTMGAVKLSDLEGVPKRQQ